MQTDKSIFVSVELDVSLWKSTSKIGVEFANFLFFINVYENTNQEHNLLPGCTFGPFTYVYCENFMSGFFTFVLNLTKTGNISF